MNTIKLYRLTGPQTMERKLVRVTQAYKWRMFHKNRNLPYVCEVLAWASKNGWSRKKPQPLRTVPNKLAQSVRRAVLDRHTPPVV